MNDNFEEPQNHSSSQKCVWWFLHDCPPCDEEKESSKKSHAHISRLFAGQSSTFSVSCHVFFDTYYSCCRSCGRELTGKREPAVARGSRGPNIRLDVGGDGPRVARLRSAAVTVSDCGLHIQWQKRQIVARLLRSRATRFCGRSARGPWGRSSRRDTSRWTGSWHSRSFADR